MGVVSSTVILSKDDQFEVYNLPRPVPGDPIPGWTVTVRQRHVSDIGKVFRFEAVRMVGIQREVTYSEVTITDGAYAGGNKPVIEAEIFKRAVWELQEKVTDWMVDHDETMIALQRTLKWGLTPQ